MNATHRKMAFALALLLASSAPTLCTASGDSKPALDAAMVAAHAAAKGDGLLDAAKLEHDGKRRYSDDKQRYHSTHWKRLFTHGSPLLP